MYVCLIFVIPDPELESLLLIMVLLLLCFSYTSSVLLSRSFIQLIVIGMDNEWFDIKEDRISVCIIQV